MKNLQKTLIASAVALTITNGVAMADSWTLIQDTDINTALTINQDSTTNAIQAVNAINDPDATITGNSSQSMSYNGATTLDVRQGFTTSNNTSEQAINYIRGGAVGEGSASINQEVTTGTVSTRLRQDGQSASGAHTNNTQALNRAIGTNTIDTLNQSVSSTSVRLDQILYLGSSGSGNLQAVNSAKTTNPAGGVTDLTQTVNSHIDLTQTASQTNTQAVNIVDSAGSVADSTQIITINDATNPGFMAQNGPATTYQYGNSVIGGSAITDTTQTITGSLTMAQGHGGIPASGGSIQAANSIESKDQTATSALVSRTSQTIGSSTETYSLTQTGSNNGTIQAGNLLRTTSIGTAADQATQELSADTLTLNQGTVGAVGDALQAGNAVMTDYGATQIGGQVTQTLAVNNLNLTQLNVNGAIQAGSYAGITP